MEGSHTASIVLSITREIVPAGWTISNEIDKAEYLRLTAFGIDGLHRLVKYRLGWAESEPILHLRDRVQCDAVR